MARPRKVDQLVLADHLACDEHIVHLDAVHAARRALPVPPILAGVTEVFAALGDPSRLRIVAVLAAGELCVCDLAAAVGLSESAVSHQLRLLRQIGVVRPRRDGRRVYYRLDDEHVSTLISQAIDHVQHRREESR